MVKITVQVKLKSKKESVEVAADGGYVVRVNVAPIEGRANKRVVELLSKYLAKPKSCFQLLSGHRGKKKIFQVD